MTPQRGIFMSFSKILIKNAFKGNSKELSKGLNKQNPDIEWVGLRGGDPNKKYLFLELENIILYFSSEKIQNLNDIAYIGEERAKKYNCQPFYIYLRPFVGCFLSKILLKYNIAIYSALDKDFMIFVLKHFDSFHLMFTA